ncbi:MAG TPA: aminoglycoside phosphotransferase family protein [Flavisolibacter sp.]|nr:aminoglycoside phosphotransferase family protein [Flavisolibacter sp.]
MFQKVFTAFGLTANTKNVVPYGSGLINHTWKVRDGDATFILQRINGDVFKNPEHIAHNIRIAASYLRQHHPHYLFVVPVQTTGGEDLFYDEAHGYFRLYPFIENTHTVDVVEEPAQAYEAAYQFGNFTKLLAPFDPAGLRLTLPHFHNLSLRYQQFEEALLKGNAVRIQQAQGLINVLLHHKHLVDVFEKLRQNPEFKLRATHHDTKISNVLFDDKGKGVCVIDLDTLMPGYFISDVGDMLRTYLSPVSEEEQDFSKIEIRVDYFKAIVAGYLGPMMEELSSEEKAHFVYAGKFMIYMQAIRFLTDYLEDDVYYGAKYEGHNFRRAGNQLVLLQKLIDQEERLQGLVAAFCKTKSFTANGSQE